MIFSDLQSTTKDKFILLGKCFLIGLLIKILATIVIIIAESFIYNGPIPILSNKIKLTDTYSLGFSILLLVLIYPILEEFAFRGWFSKNRILITISLTTLSFYFLHIFINILLVNYIGIDKVYRLTILYASIPFFLYLFYFNFFKIEEIIDQNKSTMIILSIGFFSLVHSFNFVSLGFNLQSLLALFIVLLPYPFSGFVYTYVRIKGGLIWSIALHILNNSFVLIPVLLLGQKV